MGVVLSKKNYTRLEANTLDQTSFECYTEVSSELRHAKIESATDQTFGSADNLLKSTEVNKDLNNSKTEEFRDGWVVKRHEVQARATVVLCNTSQLFGFDIDTTGFKSACPTHALVEGFKVSKHKDEEGVWVTLIQEEPIKEDSHNFFELKEDNCAYSHVRLTISPGGGVARFRTYGVIAPNWVDMNREFNLASANHGARIVRWTDTTNYNKPNVLLDNGTHISDGWLTPRSRKSDRDDFIVIQLSAPGTLNSIVIDTTGFIGNSPNRIHIEGCNTPEDDPYQNVNTFWVSLVPESDISDDSIETFAIIHDDVITHVRLTLLPDGGLQQIKCFGFIVQEEIKQLPYEAKNLITIADDRSFSVDNSEDTFVAEEDEPSHFEKPTINELSICNNNHLSPPPTVKKPVSTPLPIEDHDLYVKSLIEELNGSTTQLLTPAIEKPKEILEASTAEIVEMNTSAVEQLHTTDVPVTSPPEEINLNKITTFADTNSYSKKDDFTATIPETNNSKKAVSTTTVPKTDNNKKDVFIATVPKTNKTKKAATPKTVAKNNKDKETAITNTISETETTNIEETTTVTIEEDIVLTESITPIVSEPKTVEVVTKEEMTIIEEIHKGKKRKSIDTEVEEPTPTLPKKKGTRGKARATKKVDTDVVKDEDVAMDMDDVKVKKAVRGRGRPKKA